MLDRRMPYRVKDNKPMGSITELPMSSTLPGQELILISNQELTQNTGTKDVAQVRPWVRFWARQIDMTLGGVLIVIALAVVAPSILVRSTPLTILTLFTWVFIEALLLSTWGTTPGKWLLKISVRNAAGEKLSLPEALVRSFSVWWRGLGLGIPMASLITHIAAYRKLKETGATTWDRDHKFVVVHENIGPFRVIAAVLLVSIVFFLASFGSLPASDPSEGEPAHPGATVHYVRHNVYGTAGGGGHEANATDVLTVFC